MPKNPRVLALFDVDGTLTEPRKVVSPETTAFLKELREKIAIGVVGGSDLVKQKEQLGDSPQLFDWCFAENGLMAHRDGAIIGQTSLKDHLGEAKLKRLINWVLHYIADLDIPIKRGTFIEFRQGMLNVSPIGRNCSREERNEFEKFDLANKVRETMVARLKEEFAEYGLTYSIGGQISFDCFPQGWDKTFCLRYLPEADFDGAPRPPLMFSSAQLRAASHPPAPPQRHALKLALSGHCLHIVSPSHRMPLAPHCVAQRSTSLATRRSRAGTTSRSTARRERSATPLTMLTR